MGSQGADAAPLACHTAGNVTSNVWANFNETSPEGSHLVKMGLMFDHYARLHHTDTSRSLYDFDAYDYSWTRRGTFV